MIRIFITAIFSLILVSTFLAQNIVELNLPNSNKVVIKLRFQNGAICDPEGKEGLTFTTANMITGGGTGKLTYSQIQDEIFPMAASHFAFVDKEVTTFTFQVPTDFLDEYYPILIDLLVNPSFSNEDFKRIKTNQQNFVEQGIRASSDEEYSKKALENLLFRGTNYAHLKEGTGNSVKAITLSDVKEHYKKYFTINNLTIGIAGNYSSEFLNKMVADLKGISNQKVKLPKPGKANTPNGITVEIVQKDNAFGSAIFAGFPLSITRADDDFVPLMIANSYLGEHRKSYSKLYNLIRETRSMNYGDYSYIEWYENGGGYMLPQSGVPRTSNYFSIWIRPVQIAKQLKTQYEELSNIKIGHAHFAFRMAMMEIDRLIKNGLTNDEFETTKDFLKSYTKLYAQTPAQQLGYLLDSKFYGRKNWIKELDVLLDKVALQDVNNAIKKYWQVENMFVTIITDKTEAAPLAESFKLNLKSPMSYSDIVKKGLPEEVLKQDEQVENFKLNVKNVKIINSEDTFRKEKQKNIL